MGRLLAVIGGLVGALVLLLIISLFLIKVGWYLFVVPVFGLPELTWLQAFGFSLLAACFRSSNVNTKKG